MNKLNIAVIGAGWFGCHIANEILSEFKNCSVVIFEEKNDIFEGASGYNQNRLHLGFHYPRSYITRDQSKKGFYKFIRKYPKFSEKIKNNFYAIDGSKKTYLSFKKFQEVNKITKLKFTVVDKKKYNYKNIEGLIKCNERLILVNKAKQFFKKKLNKNLKLNTSVTSIKKIKNKFKINDYKQEFDILINCTWQKFSNIKKWNLTYEICVCLLYENKTNANDSCLTVMDGPFYTLYKWNQKLFNLYSVKYSRIKKFDNYYKAKKFLNDLSLEKKLKVKSIVERNFIRYHPNFKRNFKFKKFISTIRTIIINKNDDRNFELNIKKNQIDVLSGKIDHICLTSDIIIKWIKKKIF
jgi:hypothetical protein